MIDRGEIENCTLKNVTFTNLSVRGNLEISNCEISNFTIEDCRITTLSIKNCKINELLIRANPEIRTISIVSNDIVGRLQIESTSHTEVTTENNKLCEAHFNLKNSFLKIRYSEDIKVQTVQIDGDIQSVEIKNLKGDSLITSCNSPSITIAKSTLEECTISSGASGIAHTTFKHCMIKKLNANAAGMRWHLFGTKVTEFNMKKVFQSMETDSLDGINSDFESASFAGTTGVILLKQTTFKNLNLNNFVAGAPSSLNSVKITQNLYLENSILEEAKFHDVNLNKTTIHFLNSSLSGTELINVQWPRKHSFHEYKNKLKDRKAENKLEVLYPLKESYRQLKVLSLDQHNKIDALEFQKHELKIYWKIVNINTWHSFKLSNLGNWLILGTNHLFSDFGQSLSRPVLWLLAVHSFLIWRLLATHNLGVQLEIDPKFWDYNSTMTGIDLFLNLLSPVHDVKVKNDFMKAEHSIFGTIDFFMRIASGYFLYYFIRATRKFNLSL